ncbi:MAG: methyltransferase domain-containing protein [Thermoanaerobaculia bacterium]|nr:methyltransferase domain-containing protein [Thermoanaerobaculia bacterium]
MDPLPSAVDSSKLELSQVIEEMVGAGGTDIGYLRAHFRRFRRTKELFEETWPNRGGRVLDIGAHWLHQAYLYARDGYEVTAADFGSTLALENVQRLASSRRIRLVVYDEIESGSAFETIDDSSFDVILFTEILEHLTFNPVAMWRQIHRMLSPGGRIVITTPNYYALRGRLWDARRFARRLGGGIPVDEILRTPTYGHHWKEYSLREVIRYFSLLSPDFVPHKALYVEDYYGAPSYGAVAALAERTCRALRPNLHLEFQLCAKDRGIEIVPSW